MKWSATTPKTFRDLLIFLSKENLSNFDETEVLNSDETELLDQMVASVSCDSRESLLQGVYVAVQGLQQDGHLFVLNALEQGARVICAEQPAAQYFPERLSKKIRTDVEILHFKDRARIWIQTSNSRKILAHLASWYYDHPSHSLKVIGITGTSGKTTSAHLVESIFKAAGQKVGLIGTIQCRWNDCGLEASHTTPDPVRLQRLLHQMKADQVQSVVMEVSSHALKQNRVDSIAFDGVLFTNLTPEHLDYHPSMEDYFLSKAILFSECMKYSIQCGKKPRAVINGSDSWGKQLLKLSQASSSRLFTATNPSQVSLNGLSGVYEQIAIESFLLGSFNYENICGCIALCCNSESFGISDQAITQGIRELKEVPGRLQRIFNMKGIYVWVDYAHKPDALQKVMQTLKSLKSQGNRLILVFGCGGDRDRAKRPMMGLIAESLADQVFITSDNPRTEDPSQIIKEIISKTKSSAHFVIEPDRRKAIEQALHFANKGDLVLIAGKGHENTQIIRSEGAGPGTTRSIAFKDADVVSEVFAQLSLTQGFKGL